MPPDPPRGFGDHTTAAEKNPAGNTGMARSFLTNSDEKVALESSVFF
jgi:hypothetical protein